MRRIPLVLALLSSLAACASVDRPAPAPAPPSASATRGLYVVLRSCAGCHAVESHGESPRGAAPSFAVIRLRTNEISLERRLVDISRNGHFEMPPVPMTADEIKDIIAYVETVGPPQGRERPTSANHPKRSAKAA